MKIKVESSSATVRTRFERLANRDKKQSQQMAMAATFCLLVNNPLINPPLGCTSNKLEGPRLSTRTSPAPSRTCSPIGRTSRVEAAATTHSRRLSGWLGATARVYLLLLALSALFLRNQCIYAQSHQSMRHVVAAVPGDLVLGALFPVRHAPVLKQAHTRTCSVIREQYGIQRVEAAFLAIDTINSDDRILPNITLGIEIRDSCWYSPIALEQSIEFIRDAMAASEDGPFGSRTGDGSRPEPTPAPTAPPLNGSVVPLGILPPASISHSPFFHLLKNPLTGFGQLNASAMCPKVTKKVKNLVGVIGPASSSVTIQVQNLLQLFNIPQIGYSATSRDLSIKSFYKYFLRVVPSDLLQARVMLDLLRDRNWTYISAVYTDGNYGSSLMEVFKSLAQEAGICIANTETVLNNAEDEVFDAVMRNLMVYKSTARVVACFCEGMTVRNLLKATRRLNHVGELLFIGRQVESAMFCSVGVDCVPRCSANARGMSVSFAFHFLVRSSV